MVDQNILKIKLVFNIWFPAYQLNIKYLNNEYQLKIPKPSKNEDMKGFQLVTHPSPLHTWGTWTCDDCGRRQLVPHVHTTTAPSVSSLNQSATFGPVQVQHIGQRGSHKNIEYNVLTHFQAEIWKNNVTNVFPGLKYPYFHVNNFWLNIPLRIHTWTIFQLYKIKNDGQKLS